MSFDPIEINADCPYCGESFSTSVDPSEDDQDYIEDCYVCCRPIRFTVKCRGGKILSVDTQKE